MITHPFIKKLSCGDFELNDYSNLLYLETYDTFWPTGIMSNLEFQNKIFKYFELFKNHFDKDDYVLIEYNNYGQRPLSWIHLYTEPEQSPNIVLSKTSTNIIMNGNLGLVAKFKTEEQKLLAKIILCNNT